ncbi:hypothetical protein D3C85_209670 [compost metagenome]
MDQVVEQAAVFRVGEGGEEQGAAEAVAALQQGHPMAALCRDPRGFHAGRTTADHHHMARRGGWADDDVRLVSGARVDRALDPLVDEDLADADVAVDARADIRGAVFDQLVGQLGVGQQLATHGDEVAAALGDGGVADVRFDAANGDHRDVDFLPDRRGPVEEARRLLDQRRLGEGHALGDRGVGGHADRVGAGSGGHHRHGLGVLQGDAAGGAQLVGIQAQPHREVGADARAHRGQHFQQQARAVLQRAAVLVVALVVIGGEEAGDDVVVRGMDLHAVEAGALGAFGCGGEPLDHLRDVGRVHHADLRAAFTALG